LECIRDIIIPLTTNYSPTSWAKCSFWKVLQLSEGEFKVKFLQLQINQVIDKTMFYRLNLDCDICFVLVFPVLVFIVYPVKNFIFSC